MLDSGKIIPPAAIAGNGRAEKRNENSKWHVYLSDTHEAVFPRHRVYPAICALSSHSLCSSRKLFVFRETALWLTRTRLWHFLTATLSLAVPTLVAAEHPVLSGLKVARGTGQGTSG